MHIIVSIGGDNSVAVSEKQLATLNAFLAETPVVDRYSNDKVQSTKRIRLEATLQVKTRTYDVIEA